VLGIDPGLRVCGWGVVRGAARPEFVGCGVIRPKTTESIGQRLLFLHEAVAGLIETYAPDEVAIEEPFVGALNPASALAIGQARSAAVLAAAAHDLEVDFYAPAAVKAAVSGYGQGDKRQVQAMVRLLLGLDAAPEPADAADALAVALCHLGNRRAKALTATGRANGPTGKRAKAASPVQPPTPNRQR
jgi:crossover junction endodeoxyribonuclease RuvC